jgi:hypothetical protein
VPGHHVDWLLRRRERLAPGRPPQLRRERFLPGRSSFMSIGAAVYSLVCIDPSLSYRC